MSGSKIIVAALLVLAVAGFMSGRDGVHAAGTKIAWGRDPFMLEEPQDEGTAGAPKLRLMGITVGRDGSPRAVINDQMVSKGSKVGKFKVLDILPNKVIVMDTDEMTEIVLKL